MLCLKPRECEMLTTNISLDSGFLCGAVSDVLFH